MTEIDEIRRQLALLDENPDGISRIVLWNFVCAIRRIAREPFNDVLSDIVPSWETVEDTLQHMRVPRTMEASWQTALRAVTGGIQSFRSGGDVVKLRQGLEVLLGWLQRYATARSDGGNSGVRV
jgi:hypothetical protein